jgi:hypothetical protein
MQSANFDYRKLVIPNRGAAAHLGAAKRCTGAAKLSFC